MPLAKGSFGEGVAGVARSRWRGIIERGFGQRATGKRRKACLVDNMGIRSSPG